MMKLPEIEGDIERAMMNVHGKMWAIFVRALAAQGVIDAEGLLTELRKITNNSSSLPRLEKSLVAVWLHEIDKLNDVPPAGDCPSSPRPCPVCGRP